MYESIEEFKKLIVKEESLKATNYIAIENPKFLKVQVIENKKLKQMSCARITEIMAQSRNWALQLHEAALLKEQEKAKSEVHRIRTEFEGKAKEIAQTLEATDQILVFNPQHQEVNYLREGLLIRKIKGVNNNSKVMRDSLDILRYYEAEIQIGSILRGAHSQVIAPVSTVVYCSLLNCRVLVQSMVPLHHNSLVHGFLQYPTILLSSKMVEADIQILEKKFNFSMTEFPQTSVLPNKTPLNSCTHLFKWKQHLYLHNVGFFFPTLSSGPFSFAHPAAVNHFVQNNAPTSVLPLSNRLFLQCSECAQYIVDNFYFKTKSHRMTPEKLKNYICCNGCYDDFKEYGGDLSCNPQILVKKQIPPEMKHPAYIDEKSMERKNSISKFKKQLSPNSGNEHLQERFYEQEKLRDFQKYLSSHVFKGYLESLPEQVSLSDLLRARGQGLAPLMGRKEWELVRDKIPQAAKREIWNWGVALCAAMSEKSEDYQQRVELGHPELRNEVNGELLWRLGVSLKPQEIEDCYRKEEKEEEEGQEENKD